MGKRFLCLLWIMTLLVASVPVLAAPLTELESAYQAGLVPKDLQQDLDNPITREEFATLAVWFLAATWEEDAHTMVEEVTDAAFLDTSNPYVTMAYEFGIVNGVGKGVFQPESGITRQEAAKMLIKAFSVVAKTPDSAVLNYSDNAEIAPWAQESAALAAKLDIMHGVGENRFAPRDTFTRKQGILTVWRMYRQILTQRREEADMKTAKLPMKAILKVQRGKLMHENTEVVLNGVNLGGWLLMESWMSPILDPQEEIAHSDVYAILTKRFGATKADALMETYRENFLTEADFQKIAELGFNCVRIPFWYRNFMTEDGQWLTGDMDKNPGFQALDWALSMCENYGLYAILDMHGCPGGQSTNHSTGAIGEDGLYESHENLETMERLWVAIAERYRDKACIAAYDVMNEPHNNGNVKSAWQAESKEAIARMQFVYAWMVGAIRSVDAEHSITVEGVWSMDTLPDPAVYGWENMMYQLHIYDKTPRMIQNRVEELLKAQRDWGVVPLVGEYNSSALEAYAAELYQSHGIHRLKWTYKTVGRPQDNWGLLDKQMNKVDIRTASYEAIKKAFGAEMRTENGFVLNQKEYEIIK